MSKIKKLKPRFVTASSKENAPNFELTKGNVKELILKNMDKQHSSQGSRFSVFTSKDDTDMCGIRISAIDFVEKHETGDEIIDMFKKLIGISCSFYAYIADDDNYKLFNVYYDKNTHTPKSLYWVNYLGAEAINTFKNIEIEIENINDSVFALEEQNNGYFIQLTETPTVSPYFLQYGGKQN